jgi:hypothetical protein
MDKRTLVKNFVDECGKIRELSVTEKDAREERSFSFNGLRREANTENANNLYAILMIMETMELTHTECEDLLHDIEFVINNKVTMKLT